MGDGCHEQLPSEGQLLELTPLPPITRSDTPTTMAGSESGTDTAPRKRNHVDPTVAYHGDKKPKKGGRTTWENFKQQTLPSWTPVFTALRISPVLLLLGIVFVCIGATISVFSEKVKEINVPYTDCPNILQDDDETLNKPCSDVIGTVEASLEKTCKCRLSFNVSEDLEGQVNIYYSLTNFYQNHRRYVSSRDDGQLRGKVGTAEEPEEPAGACAPFDREEEINGTQRIYFPCGAIANSMFSDRIQLFYRIMNNGNISTLVQVPLNKTGISWKSDKKYKFKNPPWFDNYSTDPALQSVFAKPMYWKKNLWELDPEDPSNNGLLNEDLIVWMRVAALPNFRKLFRIINQQDKLRPEFANGMPKGEYVLEIDYNFPVKNIEGTKTIVFTTTSNLGSAGLFLGIAYLITGGICVFLAIFFLIIHIKTGTKRYRFNSASNFIRASQRFSKIQKNYGSVVNKPKEAVD